MYNSYIIAYSYTMFTRRLHCIIFRMNNMSRVRGFLFCNYLRKHHLGCIQCLIHAAISRQEKFAFSWYFRIPTQKFSKAYPDLTQHPTNMQSKTSDICITVFSLKIMSVNIMLLILFFLKTFPTVKLCVKR